MGKGALMNGGWHRLPEGIQREKSGVDEQEALEQELHRCVSVCKYTFGNEAGRFPDARLQHE